MRKAKYKRVLVKLSGESLGGSEGGFCAESAAGIASELSHLVGLEVQVAAVVGGGNFLRGRDLADNPTVARVTADYMGMLATNMNAIALRDTLASMGVKARVFSAISDPRICEPANALVARSALESGEVVIFAGGTGNPFFTTDTAAALRAAEIGADVLLKSTTVDGVYDSDPKKNPAARRYDELTYAKVLADRLGVMDLTAISLCMENRLPVMVFRSGKLVEAVCGEKVGTVIS